MWPSIKDSYLAYVSIFRIKEKMLISKKYQCLDWILITSFLATLLVDEDFCGV